MKEKIEIIYEDENVIAVSKASGIYTIAGDGQDKTKTVLHILSKQIGEKLIPIHILDVEASGVLVFAKNATAYEYIRSQFENKTVVRKYITLLSGFVQEDEGEINMPILISSGDVSIDVTGKEAITKFKVLERFKSYTLVEAFPVTSMRCQLRAHFWSIGNPIAIDAEFGVNEPILLSSIKRKYKSKKGQQERPLISRLTLHLESLTLKVPNTNEKRTFISSLPKDFEITLNKLEKYGR
ncbi:MAG: RluA family pseudouridine synthase [Endomicrobium sp.]|jgi:23S rRNA pseudouridine955/2504/2580 synthase/23S rRNA pseudouridine1911/1915/1917 synthase|nr:RluA family pseudouridine synthase [Endomicrobium sp.]